MTKWKKTALEAFSELKPTRAAGFTTGDDGKTVLVSGLDEPVTLVLNNKTDLMRLKGMVDFCLSNYQKK